MDIYKIPQPVPVDISFQVKIVCNRMRELNVFNKNVIEKFSSRQAYSQIKGHYIPIIMTNISDESVLDIEKRKYYVQNYDFTMLGFLIDEDEFEVSPAVSRVLQVLEVDLNKSKKQIRKDIIPQNSVINGIFVVGNNTLTQLYNYTLDVIIGNTNNITTFDVYINDDYYGSDLTTIQLNTNDILKIEVIKTDDTLESTMELFEKLI